MISFMIYICSWRRQYNNCVISLKYSEKNDKYETYIYLKVIYFHKRSRRYSNYTNFTSEVARLQSHTHPPIHTAGVTLKRSVKLSTSASGTYLWWKNDAIWKRKKPKRLIHVLKIGTNGASFRQPYVKTHCMDISSRPGVMVIVPGLAMTSIDVCANWTKASVKVLRKKNPSYS